MPKWRGPKLDYMFPIFRGKRWHTYYRRKGKYARIVGEPGTAEWHRNYAEIHEAYEPDKPDKPKYGTIAHVVIEYLEGPKWERIAEKTKTSYRPEIEALVKMFGDAKADQITRPVIVGLRDKIAESKSPRAAIERIKVLRILLGQAYDMGLVERNHAFKLGKPVGYKAEPWRPWEQDEIDLFLAQAAPRWRRAVMVLLHTGLRAGDAVKVRRGDIKDGILRWTAHKTDTPVVVPIHADLKAEIAKPMDVESVYLIAGSKGRPLLVSSISSAFAKQFRKLGVENPPPVHGLRKNAVMRLLEVGCTKDEVRALTGQSDEMIEHYGQKFDREKLARAAVVKLEKR